MQPAALAAGKLPDVLLLVAPLEVEAPEIGARRHLELAHGQDVLAARDRLPGGLVVRQRLARLVDDGELDGVADDDFTGIGLFAAGDQPEERRLAGPVRADDADDGARRGLERELVPQQPIAAR